MLWPCLRRRPTVTTGIEYRESELGDSVSKGKDGSRNELRATLRSRRWQKTLGLHALDEIVRFATRIHLVYVEL